MILIINININKIFILNIGLKKYLKGTLESVIIKDKIKNKEIITLNLLEIKTITRKTIEARILHKGFSLCIGESIL